MLRWMYLPPRKFELMLLITWRFLNNRSIPSCLLRPCKNESSCENFHMNSKMCSTRRFIFMQMKLIYIWKSSVFIDIAVFPCTILSKGERCNEVYPTVKHQPVRQGHTTSPGALRALLRGFARGIAFKWRHKVTLENVLLRKEIFSGLGHC